ncbi:UNVERIFIED_CONTAM: hypothetical protein Sindi_1847200, partial [Sesamum indicum]
SGLNKHLALTSIWRFTEPEYYRFSKYRDIDKRMGCTIKIATTTLELNKENFIKLVELSCEGSAKIGWDNTVEDTKASIFAGDSKGAIADRLGRLIKIHFIGDGYFEGSGAEKAREYAQALFSLELTSICAVDEYIYLFRKYFVQSGVATEENQASQGKGGSKVVTPTAGVLGELFPDGDHGGPSPMPENINLDNEQDQQGFHPKDLDEHMQDPPEEPPIRRTFRRVHTRANEGFKDCNCWTYGAKGHISLDCQQKCGELRKFEATDDILDAVYYGDLVPIYRFEELPSDENVYEGEIQTDSDGSSI